MVTRRKVAATQATQIAEGPSGALVARSIRRRRKLTLEQVAQATGLSRGHLSRYERGEKSLSLAALMRLARALDTSVSALLGESAPDDSLHVVHTSERAPRHAIGNGDEYEFVPLSRPDSRAGASAFIVQLGTTTVGEHAFHEGDEMFFVLRGSVDIELGPRSVRLREGDFAEFPGMVRHRLRGLEPGTEVLVVVTEGGHD